VVLAEWIRTAGFKKLRAAKMGHFGRWNLQQWDALGPLLHGWEDRRFPVAIGRFGRCETASRPGAACTVRYKCVQATKPSLTWNARIEVNKGVWLGCHGGALTLFHPEVRARPWQLSSDHNPPGGLVRRTGSNRVSSRKSAPPKPKDILWKSAEDQLWLRYQEIVRLRSAVQEAEAAADQPSKKAENR
jgi:hypothetical protein